jgi:hypothetical protein
VVFYMLKQEVLVAAQAARPVAVVAAAVVKN